MSRSWIPWFFVLLFIPVFAVNGLLIRYALSSSTGLVSDRAFDTGQGYNQVIEAGRKQDALGWTGSLGIVTTARRVTLTVTMLDKSGAPLRGLAIAGRLRSPVDPVPDQAVRLEEQGAAAYSQTVNLPRAGQWDLELIATKGEDRFALQKRLVVPELR